MLSIIVSKLKEAIEFIENTHTWAEFEPMWERYAYFLRQTEAMQVAQDVEAVTTAQGQYKVAKPRILGLLEGVVAQSTLDSIDAATTHTGSIQDSLHGVKTISTEPQRVFVVHGHDESAKEIVARFLHKLGLKPIILHEQTNSGHTIIEKFEDSAKVDYAVVLLTPDDVGSIATDTTLQKFRARQNVILELGYFMGRLGRSKVCAIRKGDVDIPSDYQGIIYIDFDQGGAWKTRVAQEIVHAGLTIDLEGLLT